MSINSISLEVDDDHSFSNRTTVEEIEIRKLTEARTKDGFRDGAVKAEEETLQKAFDAGYEAGYKKSYNIARFHGVFWMARSGCQNLDVEQTGKLDTHCTKCTDQLDDIVKEFLPVLLTTPAKSLYAVEPLVNEQLETTLTVGSVTDLIEKHKSSLIKHRLEFTEVLHKAGINNDLIHEVFSCLER